MGHRGGGVCQAAGAVENTLQSLEVVGTPGHLPATQPQKEKRSKQAAEAGAKTWPFFC